jgi:hypothetical protein
VAEDESRTGGDVGRRAFERGLQTPKAELFFPRAGTEGYVVQPRAPNRLTRFRGFAHERFFPHFADSA